MAASLFISRLQTDSFMFFFLHGSIFEIRTRMVISLICPISMTFFFSLQSLDKNMSNQISRMRVTAKKTSQREQPFSLQSFVFLRASVSSLLIKSLSSSSSSYLFIYLFIYQVTSYHKKKNCNFL